MNRVAARVHFPDEMTTLSAPTRSAPLPVDNARLAGVAKTVVRAVDLGKCYHVYEKPADRLKQALLRWHRQYFKDFWAIRGVNFTIPAGQAVGIIGRNGSGKSTILRVLAGVLAPTTGSVTILGKVNALLELGAGFNPEFTGRENVMMSGAVQGFSPAAMESITQRVAAFAEVGDFFDQPMKTYSSGMYVRVAFAAAVMMTPDVLVVDEALSVGDIFFQQRCMRHMREELAGVTKILVTHDMASIASLCERCLVMHEGALVFDGSPAEAIEYYTRTVHSEEFRRDRGRLAGGVVPPVLSEASAPAPVESEGARLAASVEPGAWVVVDGESIGGAGEVVITRVALTNARGERLATARPGDRCVAWMMVRSAAAKRHLIFGTALVDRTGTHVCGDNSL
ncbi:MAG TPA: ABC transporter ATP-binding protein, partial [Phycisphaerales bacterium]|nr:ABC transporter ATP-binding protein [Phycisphaerales bacterium]